MVLLAVLVVVVAVLFMVLLALVEHPHRVKGLLVEMVLFKELPAEAVVVVVLLL
jgi:hypothetical protein